MKARLLFFDRDVEPVQIPRNRRAALDLLSWHSDPVTEELVADLDLATLWKAMAGEDEVLMLAARQVTLAGTLTVGQVTYRQHVFADCLAHPEVVRRLYATACAALKGERTISSHGFFSDHGDGLLSRSVQVIEMVLDRLRDLRRLSEEHAGDFHSKGFDRFFAELRDQLDDDYFAEVEQHLSTLHLREGFVLSARLGQGNQGAVYVLREPNPENRTGLFTKSILKKPTYGFTIPDRDEASFHALGRLRDRGLDIVAADLAQAADHVLSYFTALRTEVGVYVAALNLQDRLHALGATTALPTILDTGDTTLKARGLYDPCLALRTGKHVAGNAVEADSAALLVITGANQGGKSTFLRSLGIAYLLQRAGLFVPAEQFDAGLADAVFAHFRREEDASMSSGKFDEELARMSRIVDQLRPGAVLLCNESFGATNEREGTDIAVEIIDALRESGIRMAVVTHMYDLAHRYQERNDAETLFLRAERAEDGIRSFQLRPAPPLPTSYGQDVYRAVFSDALAVQQPAVSTPAPTHLDPERTNHDGTERL